MAGVLDGGNAIGINCGYGGCGQLISLKQNDKRMKRLKL